MPQYLNKFLWKNIIIALELEESNFKLLEKNVSAYLQVKAIKEALRCESRQIHLVDPGQGHHRFQTMGNFAGNNQQSTIVNAVTMDELMIRMNLKYIDVLKIDIEGAEKEVFENSKSWIDKVNVIMIELHNHIKAGCSRAFLEASSEFTEQISKGEVTMRMRKIYVTEKINI